MSNVPCGRLLQFSHFPSDGNACLAVPGLAYPLRIPCENPFNHPEVGTGSMECMYSYSESLPPVLPTPPVFAL